MIRHIKIKKLKLNNDSLFQVGYFFLIINQVLAQSQYNEMDTPSIILKITRWLLIIYFLFLILKKNIYPNNKKGLFWLIFALLSVTEMIFFNGKLLLIILFVIVISSYKTDLNLFLKSHVLGLICGQIIVILSSLIGILDKLGVYKQFDNVTGFLFKRDNIRYAFGFVNSNIIPITCLYLYLYLLLIKKNNFKLKYDILAILINYIVFLFCGSRVCILLLFLAIVLRWLVKLNKNNFIKIFVPGTHLILVTCLLCSIVLPVSSWYHMPVVTVLDNLLTARISIMRNVLGRYPITLWGYGEINIDNSIEYLVMDNGYLALFVTRGLLIGVIFVIILFVIIQYTKKSENPYLLILIIIMIVGNFVDNSILHYITFPIYVIFFNRFINIYCERK